MTALMISHAIQFKKVLAALKKRFLWFWLDSRIAEILTLLTFVTGFVKLCSPVKIPHLSLWHYAIGIALEVIVAIHLVRSIPAWNRLRK